MTSGHDMHVQDMFEECARVHVRGSCGYMYMYIMYIDSSTNLTKPGHQPPVPVRARAVATMDYTQKIVKYMYVYPGG